MLYATEVEMMQSTSTYSNLGSVPGFAPCTHVKIGGSQLEKMIIGPSWFQVLR